MTACEIQLGQRVEEGLCRVLFCCFVAQLLSLCLSANWPFTPARAVCRRFTQKQHISVLGLMTGAWRKSLKQACRCAWVSHTRAWACVSR